MTNFQILKRLYKNYTSKFIRKIFLSILFSVIVAVSTSSIAYLLDPAIEKIFLDLLSHSGYPNVKFETKVDFNELYKSFKRHF